MKTPDIAIANNVILPDGYRYGAHVAGSVWYLIREADGASILARTGDDDGCIRQSSILGGTIAMTFRVVVDLPR